MKKLLFMLLALFLPYVLHSESLSSELAVNVVKQIYSKQKFSYSFAKVTNIVDNQKTGCEVSATLLKENKWLAQCDSLWLVFVDEKPMQGWTHPCKYVYLPAHWSDTTNIPILTIEGNRPPFGLIDLVPFGKNGEGAKVLNGSHKDAFSFYSYKQKRMENQDDLYADGTDEGMKTEVAIINCFPAKSYNYLTYYFDMRYFYEVLHEKYGIPSLNFSICASAEYVVDSWGNSVVLDRNALDFLYSTCSIDLKKNEVIDFLKCQKEMDPDHDFVLYFSGHGGFDENNGHYYVCLPDGDLYDYELKELLDSIPAKYQTIIMENCHSGGFINALKAKSRTIITACDSTEESAAMLLDYDYDFNSFDKNGNINVDVFYRKNYYNLFSHMFTSALSGVRNDYDIDDQGETIPGTNNRTMNSDSDLNGRISLSEAFIAANDCINEYIEKANAVKSDPNYFCQHAQFCSTPSTLGEDFAFNHIPERAELYIRDNELDLGKEANTTTSIHWDSPDMWTSIKDGHTEKTLHGLDQMIEMVNNANTRLYTYVRVTNRGVYDYLGYGNYLHIMWSESSLTPSEEAWFGNDDNLAGGCVSPVEITQPILVGESCIVKVPWTLPSIIYEKAKNEKTNFSFNLLACVSNKKIIDEQDIVDTLNSKMPSILSLRNLARKSFEFINPNGGDFAIGTQISTPKCESQSLSIVDDSANDVSVFNAAKIELNVGGSQQSVFSGNAIPVASEQKMRFIFKPEKNNSQAMKLLKCHAVLANENGDIAGGQVIRLVQKDLGQSSNAVCNSKIDYVAQETGTSYKIKLSESVKSGSIILLTSTLTPQKSKVFEIAGQNDKVFVDLSNLPFGPIAATLIIDGEVADTMQFINNK